MQIKKETINDITILYLSGRMSNDSNSLRLYEHVNSLVDKGHSSVIIDLQDVTRFSSNGLASLLAAYSTLSEADGELIITGIPDKINNMLTKLQLMTLLKNYRTVNDAVNHLSATA